jgi:hypothetical protein
MLRLLSGTDKQDQAIAEALSNMAGPCSPARASTPRRGRSALL